MFLFFAALDCVDDVSEKERISQLYYDYSSFVKKIVYVSFPNFINEAEDITQSVFISVLNYKDIFFKLDEKGIKRLLIIYTRSVCFNIIDKRVKDPIAFGYEDINDINIADRIASENDVPGDYIKENYIKEAMLLIEKLPYPVKRIIELKYIFNFSNVEISKVLNMSESNVSTTLHRALKKLRKQLGGSCFD